MSVQNLGAGVPSLFAGAVIGHTADGALKRFEMVGVGAVILTLACLLLARGIQPVASLACIRRDAANPITALFSISEMRKPVLNGGCTASKSALDKTRHQVAGFALR